MSETPAESPHEKRVRTFLVLRMFGPKTDQWNTFFEESEGRVRRRPGVTLTEEQLAAELAVFKGEMEMMGTWPVILVIVLTPLIALGCFFWKGWLVALGVIVGGVFVGSTLLGTIQKRKLRLWEDFERQVSGP